MKTTITKGLTEEETKEISMEFISSVYLRKRLISVLEDRISSARQVTISSSSYDSPSWAYSQADNNGYERGLREVISLLS